MTSRTFIRHIVFFSAKDKADESRIVDGLSELAKIPHSDVFEVRQNSHQDTWSDEMDVVVYGEFKDQDALAAYMAHPIYQEAIRVVKPLRELRIAADI